MAFSNALIPFLCDRGMYAMSIDKRDIESGAMPDWTAWETDEIDRIDWRPVVELAKAREWAPRALAEDA